MKSSLQHKKHSSSGAASTTRPITTRTSPSAPKSEVPQQARARNGILMVVLLSVSGLGIWGVWHFTQSITPATLGVAPPVAAPALPVVKDKQGAAQAFAEARRLENYIVGPWIPTYAMTAQAEKAVALDPTQQPYLVYLMQIYVSLRKTKEAIEIGKKLLAINPEHPWGNVMLANQLLDNGAKTEDLPKIEAMLKFAESDPKLAPALHYGHGVVALRRHQAETAVRELKQACDLAPYSSTGYYNLFLAEKMAGDTKGAAEAMAKHDLCVQKNTDALRERDAVTQHPESLPQYVHAIRVFESKGLQEPADKLRRQGHQKYGAALDTALQQPTETTQP